MAITIGMTHSESALVDDGNVASAVGSGLVDVFATPMMLALMEKAAAACIQGSLAEGESSVGTLVAIEHTAATPKGMRVTATATVTAVDRRRVDFTVAAHDETGEIGRGTHTRFVIDKEKFLVKALAKLDGGNGGTE